MQFENNSVCSINQGIDTLKLNFICQDILAFNSTFAENKEKIILHKKLAQDTKGFSNKDRGSKINLGGYIFDVKPQAANLYVAYLENDDCYIKISNGDYRTNTPHISVDFRSRFLWTSSLLSAYNKVLSFVKYLFGSHIEPIVKVSEFHYCNDIMGIKKFDSFDFNRFQYLFKDFKQYSNSDDNDDGEGIVTQYTTYKNISGYMAGKNNFAFRIYNKTLQIKTKPETAFIKKVWKSNGFDVDFLGSTIYRHEVQFRRKLLKNYIPKKTLNEFLYLLDNDRLSRFWKLATDKLVYLPLTDDECKKLDNAKNRFERYNIIRRVKKDKSRFNYWDVVKQFNKQDNFGYLDVINTPKRFDEKYLFSAVKTLMGLLYKCGYRLQDLPNVFERVSDELFDKFGYGLEKYSELKMLGSFTYNYQKANYKFEDHYREHSITAHNIEVFEYFRDSEYFKTKKEVRKFKDLELPTLEDYIKKSEVLRDKYMLENSYYQEQEYYYHNNITVSAFEDYPLLLEGLLS
jgi:hypothetical protein